MQTKREQYSLTEIHSTQELFRFYLRYEKILYEFIFSYIALKNLLKYLLQRVMSKHLFM